MKISFEDENNVVVFTKKDCILTHHLYCNKRFGLLKLVNLELPEIMFKENCTNQSSIFISIDCVVLVSPD